MNIRLLLRIFIGLSLTLPLSPLYAHHGMLGYDTGRLLELKGTVVGFELLDPHSLLYIDVEEDGKLVSWTIEGGKANGIVNAGLSAGILTSNESANARMFGWGLRGPVEQSPSADIHRLRSFACKSSCREIHQLLALHPNESTRALLKMQISMSGMFFARSEISSEISNYFQLLG